MVRVFDQLTNCYSLSKTLRFELKPVGKTLAYMKEHGIIKNDEVIEEAYQNIKELLDKLHNDFIVECLSVVSFDWSDFLDFYVEYRNAMSKGRALDPKEKKKWQKDFDNQMDEKRKLFSGLYEKTAEDRKSNPQWVDKKGKKLLKKKSYSVLLESGIINVLGIIHKGDAEKQKYIESFSKFTTYLTGYNQNRENYYTVKGNSTEVAYRIVDQNLLTFCNNLLLKQRFDEAGFAFSPLELQLFDISFYNKCLVQEGIDVYNALIGRKSHEEGVKGINQRVNEYNQELSSGARKLPKFKQLYKQIGSPKQNVVPFVLIENKQQLRDLLDQFLDESQQYNQEILRLMDRVLEGDVDNSLIHMTKNNFTYFSNKYFSSWYVLQDVAGELGIFPKAKKGSSENYTVPAHVSLGDLKSILDELQRRGQSAFKGHLEYEDAQKRKPTALRRQHEKDWEFLLACMAQDFEKLFSQDEVVNEKGKQIRFVGFDVAKSELESTLPVLDIHNQEHKNIIKRFADSSLALLRFVKMFRISDESVVKDTTFYEDLEQLTKAYPVHKRYDAIRNFLTKKPYSKDKMKLNFENATLGDGWDKNKEVDNSCVLLRDRHKYYLAIMKKDNNKLFRDDEKLYEGTTISELQKMEYKQIAAPTGIGGFVRKCFGTAQQYGWKCPEDCLNHEKKIIIKNDEAKSNLDKIIDCYKDFFDKYEKDGFKYKNYDFNFKDSSQYDLLSDFYRDVELQGYQLSRTSINKDYLREQADTGNVYLFEVSSKDFSGKSKTKDLQSIYWENVFVPGASIKLNGGAEVFFRKPSMKKKKKNIKNPKDHIIKHKRYTEEKVLFYVPITLGFGGKELTPYQFNQYFNQRLLENKKNIKILGIDRGEKHLAFYSVIDLDGRIIEQGTLNVVGGLDYEDKLKKQAATRLQARQNWETIGNIKNLKDGYISYVIRKIADLMIKHKAVVVFEDLNSGFKRGRQKIEQSVYQKLELALAKKLSFLVNKGTEVGKPGSSTNAYQLCPKLNTFGDIKGKQRGAILYTRAHYTSTTCPITGWRKNLYLKKGRIKDMRETILQFDAIGYDKVKDAFFFAYDPTKFSTGKGKKKRTVWSFVDRFRGKKDRKSDQWKIDPIDVTQNLKDLLNEQGMTLSEDILSQIASREDLQASYYEQLIWNFDVIMQIRNTGNDERDSDFVHSPVEPFFDSRKWKDKCFDELENTLEKPTSGDANGAYNIARKGIMMVNKILDNPEKPDLFVSDQDRDAFVQN